MMGVKSQGKKVLTSDPGWPIMLALQAVKTFDTLAQEKCRKSTSKDLLAEGANGFGRRRI